MEAESEAGVRELGTRDVGPPDSGIPDAGPIEPRWSSIFGAIVRPRCNCHWNGPPFPSTLDLSSLDSAYDHLVGTRSWRFGSCPDRLLVDPGNASGSLFYRKVRGMPDLCGSRMPFQRDPLAELEIDAIREWIEGGALRD